MNMVAARDLVVRMLQTRAALRAEAAPAYALASPPKPFDLHADAPAGRCGGGFALAAAGLLGRPVDAARGVPASQADDPQERAALHDPRRAAAHSAVAIDAPSRRIQRTLPCHHGPAGLRRLVKRCAPSFRPQGFPVAPAAKGNAGPLRAHALDRRGAVESDAATNVCACALQKRCERKIVS